MYSPANPFIGRSPLPSRVPPDTHKIVTLGDKPPRKRTHLQAFGDKPREGSSEGTKFDAQSQNLGPPTPVLDEDPSVTSGPSYRPNTLPSFSSLFSPVVASATRKNYIPSYPQDVLLPNIRTTRVQDAYTSQIGFSHSASNSPASTSNSPLDNQRLRTAPSVFHNDLAAHHGIAQSLPPAPRTIGRISPTPEIDDFSSLCSEYLNMLSQDRVDPLIVNDSQTTSQTLASDGQDAVQSIMDVLMQGGDILTSPMESPFDDFLTTPFGSEPTSPIAGDDDVLDSPLLSDRGPSEPPFPLWKRLLNPDVDSREFALIFTKVLGSREEAEPLKRVEGEEALAFINNLDRYLNSSNLRELRQKCLAALRKTCRRCRILPTSYRLSGRLERTKDHASKSGGFADVWEGTYNDNQVAIKVLRVRSTDNLDRIKERLCHEAVLWKQLSHPNLLPFLGISITRFEFCLVSSWMRYGNIVDYVSTRSATNRLELLVDVGNGLQYLHDSGCVHGDLKGVNILINDAHRACLADFGLLTILSDHTTVYTSTTLASTPGTTRWMAPELLDPENYGLEGSHVTKETDIYALGMVIFEVLTGSPPFQGYRAVTVIHKVTSGIRPKKPTNTAAMRFSDPVWKLVEDCWHADPTKRPPVLVALDCLDRAAIAWTPLSPVTNTIEPLGDEYDSDLFSDE